MINLFCRMETGSRQAVSKLFKNSQLFVVYFVYFFKHSQRKAYHMVQTSQLLQRSKETRELTEEVSKGKVP